MLAGYQLPTDPAELMLFYEEVLKQRIAIFKLDEYDPTGTKYGLVHAKQVEFHQAGADHNVRAFFGGNRTGKSVGGGAEDAYHLTGRYPDWWEGRRFDEPTRGWAASDTTETTRDNIQRALMGPPDSIGSGLIPAKDILSFTMRRGVADAMDKVYIRHQSGGTSELGFKSFDQGRKKFQGTSRHFVHFDEEPPYDVYREGQQRVTDTDGLVYLTMTPLQGMSRVARLFFGDEFDASANRYRVIAGWRDNPHLSEEVIVVLEKDLPEHERQARQHGLPQLGSGLVYPVLEADITVEAFPIPAHWSQLGALDFGWDHPTAAVRLAWDRDNDIVYVTAAYRKSQQTPLYHAAALKKWGSWLPWAWPHDGLQHDKASGETIKESYLGHGLKMLPDRATFEDGKSGVEAGILEILDRMQTGRFKVFSHLSDWFQEFRVYHREEGLIVKEEDDLMDASRYGIMMLRFATVRKVPMTALQRKLKQYRESQSSHMAA